MLITQQLYLNMLGLIDEFLNEQGIIAEGIFGFILSFGMCFF